MGKRLPTMHKGKATWRLYKLPPGGSEFFEGTKIKVASGMASRASKALGRSFYCRSVDGGVRIYRDS